MEQSELKFDMPFEEGISPAAELKGAEKKSAQPSEPHVYTVSQLTASIKEILENQYPDVWVIGEVSNLRTPNSKNYYFMLKDESTQLHAVLFGGKQRVSFDLEDGLELICHGRIGVYGARGEYQVIIDYCEPKGKGALQLAFEQLKKRLEAEGLFAKERKRAVPFLPKKIGVVTSPTGAAVRDIINILTRRFPTVEVLIIPVKVQGEGAADEIARAINEMNTLNDIDVMIVGRGGGSIEDLWAFNEEAVARAIFASEIPVISAVGHEVDFTIADFVADVRAATPSAAAELAVPKKTELVQQVVNLKRQLIYVIKQDLLGRWSKIQEIKGRIADPSRRFPDIYMRLDSVRERLCSAAQRYLSDGQKELSKLQGALKHLSPLYILEKGYAIVTRQGAETPVRSSKSLKEGTGLEIRFHEGTAAAKVTKVIDS